MVPGRLFKGNLTGSTKVTMVSQQLFGLAVSRNDGVSLTKNQSKPVTPAKLFADLLKPQARRIMGDITECPVDTIPAHLARLDDLREIFRHVIRHDFAETPESRLSGVQLLHPVTLADYLAALEITRQTHRAPAFVNSRDTELAEINLDVVQRGRLAGR